MKKNVLKFYKNKKLLFFFIVTIIIVILSIFKNERIIYLPFNIPGKQMAVTIPPFGIFIESKYKHEGNRPGSVLSHEKVHWRQFRRMGLLSF